MSISLQYKMFVRCFYIGICLLSIIAWGAGCGVDPTGDLPGGKRSFTGGVGPYNLTSQDAVQEFNAQAKNWFTERGFVEIEDVTYHKDILRPYHEASFPGDISEDWNKPGVLLLLEYDHQNRIYVFIPDCFRPEDNTQFIGYHARLTGTVKEIKKHEDGFEKMSEDFLEQFPPNPSPYR